MLLRIGHERDSQWKNCRDADWGGPQGGGYWCWSPADLETDTYRLVCDMKLSAHQTKKCFPTNTLFVARQLLMMLCQ